MHTRLQRPYRRLATVLTVAGVLSGLAVSGLTSPSAYGDPTPATEFRIDCGQPRNGEGTTTSPWNSLQSANNHAAFAPGDKILLRRATTCKGALHPTGSGSKGSPIVIGAYGAGNRLPTIVAGGTKYGSGAVTLHNQSYWTVQDLHISNHGVPKETKAYRSGIFLSNVNGGRIRGITVQRLRIDSVTSNLGFDGRSDAREWGGISALTVATDGKSSGFNGLRVLHNSVSGVGRTGIVVSNRGYPASADDDVRIAYNSVRRSRGDSIVVRGSIGARIDHNLSADGASLWPCKQCGPISPNTADAGIWTATSKGVRIDHNEVYGEHRLGGDGEGIDADMSAVNTIIEANYVHDNEGGGILFCGSGGAIARFNILENNKSGEFVFIGSIPATNTKIYNNTVYTSMKNGSHVVHTQGNKGGKQISFFNNLVYNMGWGYYEWPAAVKTRNNSVIGTHGLGEPRDPWTIFDTPVLRNPGFGGNGVKTLGGYHPASPTDDAKGIAIPKTVKQDFFGNTINPKKPPRGAAAR